MEFFIHAQGTKQVATRFQRMGFAATHAQPAFETIGELLFATMSAVFESQGRRGGGSWRSDSPEWAARKQREGLDPRINHATLALRRSVTERDAPGQIFEVTNNALFFGSDLPYAGVTQQNRPFMKLTVGDRTRMRTIIRDYLMAAWRGGVPA